MPQARTDGQARRTGRQTARQQGRPAETGSEARARVEVGRGVCWLSQRPGPPRGLPPSRTRQRPARRGRRPSLRPSRRRGSAATASRQDHGEVRSADDGPVCGDGSSPACGGRRRVRRSGRPAAGPAADVGPAGREVGSAGEDAEGGAPGRGRGRGGAAQPGGPRGPGQGGAGRGPAVKPRGLRPPGRPARPGGPAGGAGQFPGTRAGPDQVRADAGVPVQLLPGCRPAHGGRPGHHPRVRPDRPGLRGRAPVQLRDVRLAGAQAPLRRQRLRRDPARPVGVGRQAAWRQPGGGGQGQRVRPQGPAADRAGRGGPVPARRCGSSRA